MLSLSKKFFRIARISIYSCLPVLILIGVLWVSERGSRAVVTDHDSQYKLNDYILSSGPIEIPGIVINASGLAFNPENNRMFVIANNPEIIVELTMSGELIRKIDLVGFQDTEDIVHIGGNRFVVIEERRNAASIIVLDDGVQSINREDVTPVVIDTEETRNKGLEGVAYDSVTRELLFVKEKGPRKLFTASLSTDGKIGDVTSRRLWPWEWRGLKDLSASYVSSTSGDLLILSDESKRLVEVRQDNILDGSLELTAGSAGLQADVQQAEGIVLDGKGNVYVCSEPNLLYVFKRG
jgi:uncharacterized protein YjiK